MAWTDQCKIAFKVSAVNKIQMQGKNKNIAKALKEIAVESDVPFETLKRWYYEGFKNDTPANSGNDSKKTGAEEFMEQKTCIRCEERPVYIHPTNGKPYSRKSKYFGLCLKCKSIQQHALALDSEANSDNGRITECPHCHNAFYIKTKT